MQYEILSVVLVVPVLWADIFFSASKPDISKYSRYTFHFDKYDIKLCISQIWSVLFDF
jgi:hypothetical protein